MQFVTGDDKFVYLSFFREGDGDVVLRANDVELLRFTEGGQIYLIRPNDSDIEKLKSMGFRCMMEIG